MISVDTNYTNLRNAEAGVEWRIVNGSNTFTVANLISGKISAGLMENVSIGNCISAELDLELWGVTVDSSNPLVVQFRADGGTTWYTKGTFYIDTLEKSPYTENTSVKAFDAMLKAEVGYMASGVWANPTDNTVVGNIASDLGIAIESATASALSTNPITLTNAPHIGANGTTDREMLSYIAMLRGGNWKITSANELQLVYPSTTPTDIAQVDLAVRNFAASETLTVSKVKVIVDSETYYLAPSNITEDAWKALAGYCIEIELPFYGTQAVANSLYTQYNGKSFVPYQAEGAYVDPKYEVGDGIRFQKDSTYYTSVIANQTIEIGWLCPSDLELIGEKKLDSLYPYLTPRERQTLYQFGELENAVDSAQSAASAAQSAVGGANYREQIIYISKPSGTNTVSANTTWVTDATGNQNTWTTTRPVYNGSYPVLFVATQRQSVAQSSGSTCTCTTPVKDQTTTVIDGGHITTGTIDASQVTVSNIDASNISTGTLNSARIAAGSIAVSQLTSAAQAALMTSSSTKTQYYLSTSSSSATGGSWSDTEPTWESGKYVWTRLATTKTFANSMSATTYSTAVYDKNLTTALSTASSASSTANTALNSIGVNLSPYFSNSFVDVYNATSNPTGYWVSRPTATYMSMLDDGWAQVNCDNTSGSSTVWPIYYNRPNTALTDANYTMLIELKDVTKTGSPVIWNSNTNGSNVPQYISDSLTITGAGSFYVTLNKTSNSSPTNFTRSGFQCLAGEKISCKVRISVYKNGYTGAYVPYVSNAANDSAVYREQTIYISKASGTTSVSANTTWVTTSSNSQNTWTTTRPVYNSSYPVLFVATQTQTMLYKGSTTCTCTTPVIDQTTTVIDGGHITTGSIDAGRITVGTLSGITISGNTITGGTLTNATSNGSVRIADGSLDFFKNATTTGTPFSQIKHVTDSVQGDSIEWSNSGYTKLVNTGGGQWTGDFIQFALNASNPSLRLLIYNADNSYVEVRNTDYAYLNGAQLRSNKTGGGDNAAIAVRNGTAADTCISLKRTDTDREIELLVGSGGTNRGLYVRDANYTGWLMYYNDTNVMFSKPIYRPLLAGAQYPGIRMKPSYATNEGSSEFGPASIFVYSNSASQITSNTMQFRLYSPTASSGSTTYTSYYEGYLLPACNVGRTSNAAYSIITTKLRSIRIWNGTLSTTNSAIADGYGSYAQYVIVGKPSGGALASMTIPKAAITTTATTWQLTDNTNYRSFNISYSGTTLNVAAVAGSGSITEIYGIT